MSGFSQEMSFDAGPDSGDTSTWNPMRPRGKAAVVNDCEARMAAQLAPPVDVMFWQRVLDVADDGMVEFHLRYE